MSIVGVKFKNHAYWLLENKLILEYAFFKAKEDRYSLLWTLYGFPLIGRDPKPELRILFRDLDKDFNNLLKTSFRGLTAQTTLSFFLLRNIGKIDRFLYRKSKRYLTPLVRESLKRDYFGSVDFLGETLFLLTNEKVQGLTNLRQEAEGRIMSRAGSRVSELPSLAFGLGVGSISESTLATLKRDTEILELEYLVKILAIASKDPKFNFLVSRFEHLLYDSLKEWRDPDLEFAIFESLRLLVTSLGHEDARRILDTLKKYNIEWAKKIERIDKELVISPIPNVTRIPKMSPVIDSLSLEVLKKWNLLESYQLSLADYREAQRAIKGQKEGFKAFNVKEGKILRWLSFILLAYSYLISLLVSPSEVIAITKRVGLLIRDVAFERGLPPERELSVIFAKVSLSDTILVVLWLFLILTYVNFLREWFVKGELGKRQVRLLPVIGWLEEKYRDIFSREKNNED
jgi:hypothetical protein